MTGGSGTLHQRMILGVAFVVAVLGTLADCGGSERNRIQGYVEGEFVYIASPLPGALVVLNVQRGKQVDVGDALFVLENTSETAAWNEAKGRLAQARANLEDARKGKRPTEIESIEAQLKQARAALTFSEKELERQEKLFSSRATSTLDLDRARSARDQDRQRTEQLEADLKTAKLGSRSDQITAAEANMRTLQAVLTRAEWDLSQKRQTAPQAGLVYDTLYRQGEWVAAGRPVVVLLPPQNIKVRAFVPEKMIGTIHIGDKVRVAVDGLREPFVGAVSFISPQAEYTPPVIFSKESRAKLVFMIEVAFDPETAADMHPGQPVDVEFGL